MIVWIIALSTFVFILLGGLFAIRFSDKLHLILGFSAGTVMGVALFDLIPESMALATPEYSVAITTLLMGLGFATYMLIDRYFSIHAGGCDHCDNPRHNNLGPLTIIFHSFIDGLAIGLSFKVSPAVGWVVAIAVLAHNFSDGINTVGAVLKENENKKTARKWLAFNALAPAAGVAVATIVTVSDAQLGLMLAFFVGLFLYLGASDLIPESHHRHPALWTSAMTILGMALIYLVVQLG